MAYAYSEPRLCACGYETVFRANWCRHRKKCAQAQAAQAQPAAAGDPGRLEQRLILEMQQQLKDKDRQIITQMRESQSQLAAKDKHIQMLTTLAVKARTTRNKTTNYIVDSYINLFGRETTSHISHQNKLTLMADPPNAVSQFIKLKHRRAPGGVNCNVRVPNKKQAIYQVVVQGDGAQKEWENRSKTDILEQLYDENSGELEAEANEQTKIGQCFLSHQDRIRESAEGSDGGRRYKEQLEKIHYVVSQVSRP